MLARLFGIERQSVWDSTELIRAELLSVERLEQHAESLAAAQAVTPRPPAVQPLHARLHDNGVVLLAAHRAVVTALRQGRAITPAAEWLADNYHVVEAQIHQVRDDLPEGYYRELPKLAGGPLAGYPRVLAIAWAFVAHTDSRFDAEALVRFVRAYQRVQPLTIGELWAVAITLRIVLVENLRRAAERIASGRAARQRADELVDRLIAAADADALGDVLRESDGVQLGATHAVQLLLRLRDHEAKLAPAIVWLDARLRAEGRSADEIVRDEHQRQGASNVSVRNVITSMRAVSAVDWAVLFERVSLVDEVLRTGPGYDAMDFASRNLYRAAVETLARGTCWSELQIAQRAVAHASAGTSTRDRDTGYPLIAGGRPAFETAVGYRPRLREWPRRVAAAAGIGGYIAIAAIVAAALLAWPLHLVAGAAPGPVLLLLAWLAVFPAAEVAMSFVNGAVVRRFGATVLPGFELADGLSEDLRTLVVVPTLLTSQAGVAADVERLEVHHLASPDGDVCFALLSDWADATAESMPGDTELLDAAAAGIARLNATHGPAPGGARFLLLHRRRRWNARQGTWMGWERKRGKLHELNRLLRGAAGTSFLPTNDSVRAPTGVRFVVTLDADTRLPRDAVRRLVGKLAHPLNRPRFEAVSGRVVEGYAILQPRVSPSLPSGTEGSAYQRVLSSASGIDPYASAVSDVYQDLCGEGSYVGKGIYDVDAFAAALDGRVAENTLLSHDLFEGVFARAALVSDVEVVEEHPSRYDVAAARTHRWARGDWQLLPWLLGRGVAGGDRRRGRIPLLGRWKMLDNLRRTLSPPATVLALLLGGALAPPLGTLWIACIVAMLAAPLLPPVLAGLVPRRRGMSPANHLRGIGADARSALARLGLLLAFLLDQAVLSADALARTLVRLVVTRRHLLEWVTAAQAGGRRPLGITGFYRRMAPSVAIAAALLYFTAVHRVLAPAIAVLAVAWLLAPLLAWAVSRSPAVAGRLPMRAADAHALRLIARRAWGYFDEFVTAEDHWLPPDNFQEDPRPVVARRTSPTNLGLYLMAAVSARDFGWIGTAELVERLEATLGAMLRLERFRGHFYNWYSTEDLRPLDPRYVSTVDSGNLAAHLLAVANACDGFAAGKNPATDVRHGASDALALARGALPPLGIDGASACRVGAERALDAVADRLRRATLQVAGAWSGPAVLDPARLAVEAAAAATALEQCGAATAPSAGWAHAIGACIASHARDGAVPGPGGPRIAASVSPEHAAEGASAAARLIAVAAVARTLVAEMRFGFLYDAERRLLSIGYRTAEGSLDEGCYDLLASEARLASFVAIAYGDVPARHWFRLGRAVTPVQHGAALVSWSGSMFEYLMPSLVLRSPAGSLLDETNRLVVRHQRAFGHEQGVPWGVSESGYNARDLAFTYQYAGFGVPSLGLKRGLGDSLVIAPYATGLAAMVDPRAAAANFERLYGLGAAGEHGFYEALDYTPQRRAAGQPLAVVRAYMAHHQGMTIVALANALLDGVMRARFHAEPRVQATELLLHERPPRDVATARLRADGIPDGAARQEVTPPIARSLRSPDDATPRTRLLSNGRYAVMMTSAGSGYSTCDGIAITRWRPDVTADPWGSYVFVRDLDGGRAWSAGFQPTCSVPERYEATFGEDRVEIVRHDGAFVTSLDVVVSGESDAEVRRVSITNGGTRARDVELTSYAELVLGPAAADTAHPAFAKLFVCTEYVPELGALLATRRRRSPEEPEVWAAHLAVVEGECAGGPQYETDRAQFIGRAGDLRAPGALAAGHALSGTVGAVLDAIFSLRYRLRILAGATARVAFWTVTAATRQAVLDLADKHRSAAAYDRAITLSWTQALVQLHHLGIDVDMAAVFQRLAGHVLYSDPSLRASSDVLRRAAGGQRALWTLGISGDLPIVLVRIDDTDDLELVRQLLRAVEYWRLKQLTVDLVILNERAPSYVQDLQVALEGLVRADAARLRTPGEGARGGVYLLRSDVIAGESRLMLLAAARAVLLSRRGSLAEQLERLDRAVPLRAPPPAPVPPRQEPASGRLPLVFDNGFGGFAPGGDEYVVILKDGRSTPAPWSNVVANAAFGFRVSADGSGCTWAGNSRDHQLTPWSNDPVSDRTGEAVYVRDDDSGAVWTPTAQPIRHATAVYVARHGRGYARFEHTEQGIALELLQFVPLDATIKVSRLSVRNGSGRRRRLSITAYAEWVLGASRESSAPFLVTEIDGETGALLARNVWAGADSPVAFTDLGGRQQSWTGDRREFIGRNGSLLAPAALATGRALSGAVGGGLDPCAALQTSIELAPDEIVELVWVLGEAPTAADAAALVARWRTADVAAELANVRRFWTDLLDVATVRTPDASFDLLMNGWLTYQTLACRVWARAGFYQASGAYGFRDQLQDGLALTLAAPALTREHLLRAAGRQFVEGDVQHWWLPATGEGVRTRISDDPAWLCYCVAEYVAATGDTAVLDERIPFLDGPRLHAGEHDRFFRPSIADGSATLFEHCARALDHGLAVGAHGLPLIGTGDWNDGMNRVGAEGRGESVWLGWFLQTALARLAALADERGESVRAERWRTHAVALQAAIERDGWDGGWYRRGYFDDGTPLGSAGSEACEVDAIAQSWAVLSGAASRERALRAMVAVDTLLVRREPGLAVLFAPPFDRDLADPGYVKAYPPGIRENGGQYTHAAAWTVMAWAELGDGDRAAELFGMLNPVVRARTQADAQRYRVEPYVVAADVYSEPPHVGRGGWTWYTGSASWLYRAGLESMLGCRVRDATLELDPCIPRSWPRFEVKLRRGASRYDVSVENPDGVCRGVAALWVDDEPVPVTPGGPARVLLVDDAATHRVRVVLG
jgi:cyclic beta-1,2-glucan synthetase